MKNDFVSVLIVSYNAERYIEKTLDSCLRQTYKDLEVLLLDNDSKDGTFEIAKTMCLRDSRLKIFRSNENIGPYAGLNVLLSKAGGEYVAIQDHDDVWLSEKVSKQVEFLKNNNNYIACGTNTFYFYEKEEVLILNKKSEITDFVDHTSLLFRNNGFRYNIMHSLPDEFLEKKSLSEKGDIFCLQEGLTIHRIKSDGTNLSANRFSFTPKYIQDFFSVNRIDFFSFLYLFDQISRKFFPEKVLWFIRKKITQRNNHWVSLGEFLRENKKVVL